MAGYQMAPETESAKMKRLQDDVVRQMQEFSSENPQIVEALGVMNMTMPDYFTALDAIRGADIVSFSSSVNIPFEVNY